MEPITTSIVIGYLALKFVDQFIKDEGYGRIKAFFFPKRKYANQLYSVILQTIDEFGKADTEIYSDGSYPFYQSEIVFSALLKHVLFKPDNKFEITESFDKFPKCIKPTREELLSFFTLFNKNVNNDETLRKLHIDENYKAEIFAISGLLGTITGKVDVIDSKLDLLNTGVNLLINKSFNGEQPVISDNYVAREEEAKLKEILKSQNVLLLTGISFCGKSQLSKKISTELISEGFTYQSRSDVNEAERFLRDTSEKRLFLLEDPFGHDSNSESSENFRRVEELIRNLPTSNKLIVTSRIEIVKSLANSENIDNASIEGNKWIELTNNNLDFLVESWMAMSRTQPEAVVNLIRAYLENPSNGNLLQVGQLNYLSRLSEDILNGKNLEELLLLAKADSKKLSAEIAARNIDSYKLFCALGLAGSTNIPLRYADLAYILSDDEETPGFQKDELFETRNFSRHGEEQTLSVYLSDYTLSEQIRSELGFLYKRGFIEIVESTIYFSHPTYREAARYLILNNNPDIDQKIDKLVLKTLACLNDRTAGVCAKQGQFCYKNVVSQELKEVFKNCAFDAAHLSIFPSVRDICFIFLLEFLSDFDETRIDRILKMVGSGLPTGDIFWENDVPFISDALNFLTDDDEFELEDVKSYLEDIKEGKSISVYNTWHVVLYLNKKDCDMSLFPGYGGCLQILNSDEAFIRAKMAFVILKSNPSADSRIFNTIFKDSHPSVIFEAIKGAFYGYPYYTDEQKDLIVPLLVNSMNDELVIIRSNNLISTFGLDYGNECIDWESVPEESKKPMWNLWTLLFPIVYSKMPDKVFISNSGRMGASMNGSVNYIDSESGLNIATIFFEWIDRRLSAEHSLDTHELSVLSYLLESTDKGEERFMLFKRIFTHPSTDFVTYSLSWCVSMWDLLNSQEVEFILDLLYSDRIDCRWLRAVSITQKSIPKEIQYKIFQNDDLFSLECSDIVAGIEDQLLEDAITLFCGEPHPISWLGLNHIGRENWYPIVKWVLINKHAVGFNQALKEMVVSYANGPAPDWKDDGLAIWTALSAGDKQNVLADRLIRETARCNCSIEPTQKMWHALIDSYTDETIDKLVAMVLDGLEAMQRYDSDDLLHFFDRKFLETYILPSSPMDQDLILISIELDKRRSGYADRVGKLIKLALESYAVIPVRLQVTFDIISKTIDKHSLDYPDLKKLEDIPNNVDKVGDEWLKHRNEHYILPDWSF